MAIDAVPEAWNAFPIDPDGVRIVKFDTYFFAGGPSAALFLAPGQTPIYFGLAVRPSEETGMPVLEVSNIGMRPTFDKGPPTTLSGPMMVAVKKRIAAYLQRHTQIFTGLNPQQIVFSEGDGRLVDIF